MRKLHMFNLVTLDGYFAGPDGNIDWHNYDAEHNDFGIEQLQTIDTLIFGRVTFQMMASYWPSPAALANDAIAAGLMNNVPKIVASRTLESADWNNTRLIKQDVVAEIARLKQQPGKDMFIFGSGKLSATLTSAGLIDEYRLIVNPIVLGSGQPLFQAVKERLPLKLVNSRKFQNGNVLLYYQPVK